MGLRARLGTTLVAITCVQALDARAIASPPAAAGDLDAVLTRFVAERQLPLLFDRKLVRGLRSGVNRHDLPVDEALATILAGTGLVATHTSSGAYVIKRLTLPDREKLVVPTPRLAFIPEILVLGHEAGNVDLPRSVNDIQPYEVLTADQIDSSLAQTTSELLSEQVVVNLASPADLNSFKNSSFGSYANFSGLGDNQTSITVDGRHLPGIPGGGDFPQTDIGALAPGSIDRVETLGLTAGAIFGVGATGGALNVVLKHDYRGFEFNILNGISQRGDDLRHQVEAKAGFETGGGRTRAMIRIGYAEAGGDVEGDRAVGRARLLLSQQLYPQSQITGGNAIFVQSADGSPLVLSPDYGGASLGHASTWLAVNAPAVGSGGSQILLANAGKPVTALAADGSGALGSLAPATKDLSITASLRQTIGDRIELFADALLLRDTQKAAIAPNPTSTTELFAGEEGNPFAQDVSVSFPTPGLVGRQIQHHDVDRETLGAIVRLGRGWSADADFSTGEATWTKKTFDLSYQLFDVDLFDGPAALDGQFRQAKILPDIFVHGRDRLYDANIRVAGPVIELPGGHATLTVTGEWRQDRNPGLVLDIFDLDGTDFPSTDAAQRETVASGFAEARLPLLAATEGFAPWRGLTLQLAARHDRYSIRIPSGDVPSVVNHQAVTSLTVGASVEPVDGLTLRSSYARGYEPPTPAQIEGLTFDTSLAFICDPKRGGCASPDMDTFQLSEFGSAKARAQQAQTLSVGVIFRPQIFPGLRVSLDYERLIVRHVLTIFAESDIDYFLDHEAEYPDRIVRGALTTQDAALGYSAGEIERLDASILNNGRIHVQTLEASVDYRRRLASGWLTVSGHLDWEPKFSERTDPGLGFVNLSGLFNGPLKLRATGSIGWAAGRLALGVNARYYGPYQTAYYDESGLETVLQGAPSQIIGTPSEHIAGKAYLDFAVSYTVPVRVGEREIPVRYRLGVRNLLDVEPSPLVTDFGLSGAADPYGELIGRRFELSISTKF